jgi:hypothetical protein
MTKGVDLISKNLPTTEDVQGILNVFNESDRYIVCDPEEIKEMYYDKEAAQAALEIVAIELGKAKGKHPEYPEQPAEALSIIVEEVGELAQAINEKHIIMHQVEEAAHVAVTAIRFIEGKLSNDF